MKVLITIPVYNEEKILEKNILLLNNYLYFNFDYNYLIEIVDNNSKDNTRKIGLKLSKKYKSINYIFIKKQGKGNAIKKSWDCSDKSFKILTFMDIDLSTDISHFKSLIDSIKINNFDLSIGSRYEKKSKIKRCFVRDFFAKGYQFIQKIFFNIKFKDTQCGFKAIKRDTYFKLKPYFFKTKIWFDKTDMFFDTELLILAVNLFNYKIKIIPVKWISGKDSKVNIFKISFLFLFYLIYLRFYLWFFKK